MKGYIKISREIVDHWIWLNPRHLKAWLYLLTSAAWEPRVIPLNKNISVRLERGQILTTIRQLMGAFGYYSTPTLDLLNVLEKEGMIRRESYSKFTIITILNFEKFQDFSERRERKMERKVEHTKEYNIYHNNNISLLKGKNENFLDELSKSEIYLQQIAAKFDLQIEDIKNYLEEFKKEMEIQEKHHTDIQDARSHFFSWLKIIINTKNNLRKNGNDDRQRGNAGDRYEARRGTAAGDNAPEDYGGSF